MTTGSRGGAPDHSEHDVDIKADPWSPTRVASLLSRRRRPPRGRLYGVVRWVGVLVFAAVVVSLVVSLVWQAAPAFRHSGFNFVFSGTWNPHTEQVGGGGLFV